MSELWRVTPHACRICFGRILQRFVGGRHQTMCAECGTTVEGSHKALCCCGTKMADGKDAGLRCIKNPHVTPETPHQVIVRHVSALPSDPEESNQ